MIIMFIFVMLNQNHHILNTLINPDTNTTSERTGAVSVMMPLSNSKSGFYIMEIWKDVKGYEGHYKISNLGKVKSLKFGGNRILKNCKHRAGYLKVCLSKNGVQNQILIHRLVAPPFISNPENKPFINHRDGNKKNNNLKNLEWCTASENMTHSFKNGFHGSRKGSLNGNAKLCEEQAKEIRQLYATKNYSQREVASKYNLSQTCIGDIVNYKRWNN